MTSTTSRREGWQGDAGASLTPSEQVLLNGQQFASQPGRAGQKEKLLAADATVSAPELAESALAAAVLANETAGALGLQTERRSSLFGLLKRSAVTVAGLPHSPTWPDGTLEAAMLRLVAGKRLDLNEMLFQLLEVKDPSPARHTLRLVKRGLAARGLLLESAEQKRFIVVGAGGDYRLPQATADLLAQPSTGGAGDLIDRCRSERPELWKALGSEVMRAFSRRTEHTDAPGWND